MDFGKQLKKLRKEAGLTQKQLASQIGVTKSVISFYELQERIPSPEVLVRLSAVFHVSTDYLLGIEKGKSLDISGLDEEDERLVRYIVNTLRQRKANQKQFSDSTARIS